MRENSFLLTRENAIYPSTSRFNKNPAMFRLLLLSALLAIGMTMQSCHSQCKQMQKTNQKLIAGNHDFGKGKEAKKYKRKIGKSTKASCLGVLFLFREARSEYLKGLRYQKNQKYCQHLYVSH